jgi:hypothetical protein
LQQFGNGRAFDNLTRLAVNSKFHIHPV